MTNPRDDLANELNRRHMAFDAAGTVGADAFEEGKHPRDKGKFSSSPGSSGSKAPPGSAPTHKGEAAVHEILGGHGMAHQPGSGYRPDLSPHQSYKAQQPVPAEHVAKSLRSQGFYPPIGHGGGQPGTMQKMYGGGHAMSLERTSAPYRTESVTLHSANGTHVDRATHYHGGGSSD